MTRWVLTMTAMWALTAAARTARAQDTPQAVRDPAALGVSVGAGARAWGMGGAFIAVADDGSAASWNPAGIAVLEKPEVSVVWKAHDRQVFDRAPFSFRSRYFGGRNLLTQTADSTVEELSSRAFDFASAAYPLRIGSVRFVPQLSYQRAIDQGQRTVTLKPFTSLSENFQVGTGDDGGRDFGTAESNESTASGHQRGGIDIWSASVGVRPAPALFVGASFNWWRNGSVGERVEQTRRATCAFDPAEFFNEWCEDGRETASSGTQTRFHGFNVNLGLLWRAGPRLRFGAVFKTPFDMQYEELESTSSEQTSARTSYADPGDSRAAATTRFTRTVSQVGPVRWPGTFGVGVAFNPRPDLTLSSDVTTTAWSGAVWTRTRIDRSLSPSPVHFSTTAISFTGAVRWPTSLPLKDSPDLEEFRISLRDQHDTFQARIGAEYVLTRRKFVLPLRAGGFVDRPYFSNGRGETVRAWGWTAGAGVVWSLLALDVAYVRQSTSYSLDLDFTTVDDGGRVDEQRGTRADHIAADRIYVSGIIRF